MTLADLKQNVVLPDILRRTHAQARAELTRATMSHGPVAQAARRAIRIYFPHFEREESTIFPALALVPDLAQGVVRPEMRDTLALISAFKARRDSLADEHRWILCAIDDMVQTASREGNKEFLDFACELRNHERMEEEILFPTVMLIGNYLSEKLPR